MRGLQEIVPLGVAILDRSIVTHKVTPTHDTRRRILPRARAAVRSTTPVLLAKLFDCLAKKHVRDWTCLASRVFLGPFEKLWVRKPTFRHNTKIRY